MKFYKGVSDSDKPMNGGAFVDEYGFGHEEFNFKPVALNGSERCLGYVETKRTNQETNNQLHIEKINGCESCKTDSSVDDVLVVWCATREQQSAVVVGWYKNATVYRNYEENESLERRYNVLAGAEDCFLLPDRERNSNCWSVPLAKKTRAYGFGQSMLWYANEDSAGEYVENLVKCIEKYKEGSVL